MTANAEIHQLAKAWVGYGIDLEGEFLKVCRKCPDRFEAEAWASSVKLRTKFVCCTSCAQENHDRIAK